MVRVRSRRVYAAPQVAADTLEQRCNTVMRTLLDLADIDPGVRDPAISLNLAAWQFQVEVYAEADNYTSAINRAGHAIDDAVRTSARQEPSCVEESHAELPGI